MAANELKDASAFKPLPGEASFPPPIEREVVGGLHIAPECITREGKDFVMAVWPRGLPRHETHRTVRFPHGLMQFGEEIEDTAARLVREQLGMTVVQSRVIHIDSYLDSQNHWHLEPWVLTDVEGEPRLPAEAESVVRFRGLELPKGALWDKESFAELLTEYIGNG